MYNKNFFEKIIYILWPVFYFVVVREFIGIFLNEIVKLISAGGTVAGDFCISHMTDISTIIAGLSMTLAVLPVINIVKSDIADSEGNKDRAKAVIITGAIAVSAALALLVNYVMNVTGLVQMKSYAPVEAAQFGGSLIYEVMIYGFLTPLMEELIFRGMILNRLTRLVSSRNAVLICSLLFGLYHMNPVQMIYAFVMGLLISAFYVKFRDFRVPYFMHCAMNIVVLLI